MGMVGLLAKKMFVKIFKNLAAELDAPLDSVKLGIYYENGSHKYEVFKGFTKEKDIELDDYCGSAVDFSGGTAVIDSTIAAAGPKYAKEMGCSIGDVNIIMKHKEKSLPDAVLMNGAKKFRNIDIEKEFLS